MSVETDIFSIVVDTSLVGLGCSISGGIDSDEVDHGVFVRNIQPGGAAFAAGLQDGDRIISCNGVSLQRVMHEQAAEALRVPLLELLVTRTVAVTNAQAATTAPLPVMRLNSQRSLSGLSASAVTAPARMQPAFPENDSAPQPAGQVDEAGQLVDAALGLSRAEIARRAFLAGDAQLSMQAHAQMATEKHTSSGSYVKTMVFGGMDGIITTFAAVASVQGAGLSTGVVLIVGFANLIADGISMAMGEYLSEHSENQWIEKERNREKWEFENFPQGELKEMVELYVEKGFSEEDARLIMSIMSKQKDFFIDHMMVQELGIMMPDEDEPSPLKKGLAMFAAFLIFGLIPLIAFIAFHSVNFSGTDPTFIIACVMTCMALFALGVIKSRFTQESWYGAGFAVLINGSLAAAAAYLVGLFLETLVDAESCN